MVDPARKLERLTVALGAAADRGLDLKPALPKFLKLVDHLETYHLTQHAFYNLTFALRAGLDPERAFTLFTIIADQRGDLGAHTFNHLHDTLKTMESYGVSPSVVFATLGALLPAPDFADEVLTLVSRVIERDVLVRGLAADHSLLSAGKAGFAGRLVKHALEQPRGTRPYFPKIAGRLRHAAYPYVIERSYEDGLRDLRALALDETIEIEGAFVFSPDRHSWYSLGGSTRIAGGSVRHEFRATDWSQFGGSPKFVHVHPRALEVFARPARTTLMATVLGPLVNRFAVVTPSKADLELLVDLNLNRAERDFELEIVTQMGVTNVTPGSDERALRHLLPYFRAYRDEVTSGLVTDYLGLPLLNQVDKMIVELNDRVRGAFEMTLYPWRTP